MRASLVLQQLVANCVNQMGLAQAHAAVQEQRVVRNAGVIGNLDRGCASELIRFTGHEVVEGEDGIELRTLVSRIVFPFDAVPPGRHVRRATAASLASRLGRSRSPLSAWSLCCSDCACCAASAASALMWALAFACPPLLRSAEWGAGRCMGGDAGAPAAAGEPDGAGAPPIALRAVALGPEQTGYRRVRARNPGPDPRYGRKTDFSPSRA